MKSSKSPRKGGSSKGKKAIKQKKRWGWKQYSAFVVLGMVIAVGLFVAAFTAFVNWSSFDPSKFTQTTQPTVVYSGDGRVYMTIQPPGGATDLPYKDIPMNLQNALVATEDHNFWTSSGIDFHGILRAAFYDIWTRSRSQGASTIEGQLAKIVYLNDDKSLSYKLKEMAMGAQLDRYFTKPDILTMYFNRVSLGEETIGVAQAAQRYFGVDLTQQQPLTLAQAALLAGLPQAPSGYDPIQHPAAALERRNEVLENMAKYGYITEQKAKATEKLPLGTSFHQLPGNAWDEQPLFTNFLLDSAQQLGISSQEVLQGGLKIYTTISPKVQNAVNQVFGSGNYNSDFPAPINGKPVDGAAIFTDPQTGAVLGAAGSRQTDYYKGGLDRVYSYSEPGSSIKPIMEYAPAIATGNWTPSSILDNTPQDFGGGYVPQNDSSGTPGKVTLQYALQNSMNIASVWLLKQIGIQTGVQFAENDGIQLTPSDQQSLTIAIGGLQKGVTPWQMAQAYEAFDNGGVQPKEHLIDRVVNSDGRTTYSFVPSSKTIMSPQVASTMTQLMEDVVQYGTGTSAQIPGWGVAGKTGTVQWDSGLASYHPDWISRVWFDGYTPNMVGSVYLGYDNPHDSTYHLSWSTAPNHYSALIWKAIVQLSEQGQAPEQFSVAPSTSSTSNPQQNKPTPPPATPVVQALTASWDPVGNGVVLNWLNSNTTVAPVFLIRRGQVVTTTDPQTGKTTTTTTALVPLNQTSDLSYEDTSVQPGQSYTYSVQALDPNTRNALGPAATASITIPGTATPPSQGSGSGSGGSGTTSSGSSSGSGPGNGQSSGTSGTTSSGTSGSGSGSTASGSGDNGGLTGTNPITVPSSGASGGTSGTSSTGGSTSGGTGTTSGNSGTSGGSGSTSTGTGTSSGQTGTGSTDGSQTSGTTTTVGAGLGRKHGASKAKY